MLGMADQARPLRRALEARHRTTNRIVDGSTLEEIHARDALAAGRAEEAVRILRAASVRHPQDAVGDYAPVLAEALQRANQPDSPAEVLEADVGDHGFRNTFFTGPVYRARSLIALREYYERRNQPLEAIAQYEALLALYRKADPELQPVVRDIRAQVERLRAASLKG
jgi:hypothetical protein